MSFGKHSFIAYIDESGDDGIKKFRAVGSNGSSHWLTLASYIVSTRNDNFLPQLRDDIISSFPKRKNRDLHFAQLDHEQKIFSCDKISAHPARFPARFVAVMSNKTTIQSHPRKDLFTDKNTLYQYLCRYLVERISDYCRRRSPKIDFGDGTVKIIFSRRGGMSYDAFRQYLYKLKNIQDNGQDGPQIYWPAIDIEAVDALDHKNRAGLQFADVVASSFSAAVEPNFYGGFEPRYAKLLAPRVLFSTDGYYLGHGIKPVPSLSKMNLHQEQMQFFDWYRKKAGRPLAPVPSSLSTTAT